MTQRIVDRQQNFWQLASIQGSAASIVALLVSGQLAKQYGAGSALIAIFVGNFVLWCVGLLMIAMSARERRNAVENTSKYLGKFGGILMAMFLVIAFISWYMLELQVTTTAIGSFFQKHYEWHPIANIRIGVVLGLLTSLLAIGGIRLIKNVCVVSLPILLIFVIYSMIMSREHIVFTGTWGISLPAIITITTLTLPGMVNLPTFFRHSRSLGDSFLALTLIMLIDIFFQCFGIFVGIMDPSEFLTKFSPETGVSTYLLLGFLFVILSMTCLNLVNIYFASAGWELILPHRWNQKEYAIVGLLGTAAYTFFQVTSSMEFIENLAGSFIVSFAASLLIGFLVKNVLQRRIRLHERLINVTCGLFGCCLAGITLINNPEEANAALVVGVFGTVISFLLIFLFEETNWAIRNLFFKEKARSSLTK